MYIGAQVPRPKRRVEIRGRLGIGVAARFRLLKVRVRLTDHTTKLLPVAVPCEFKRGGRGELGCVADALARIGGHGVIPPWEVAALAAAYRQPVAKVAKMLGAASRRVNQVKGVR